MKLLKTAKMVKIITTASTVTMMPLFADATQIKLAADNAEISGKLSVIDINRLSLVNDRIKSVKTNKYGYEFINDEASGDVYIKTTSDNIGDPLNAFIISEKGFTYKLLLSPLDIPSEQIFIKNPAITTEESQKENNVPLPYKEEIVRLIKQMGKGEIDIGYQVKSVKIPVYMKDRSLRLTKRVIYQGTKYEGLIYDLKNLSEDVKEITEELFAKQGIRAIKLDKLSLKPDEIVNVYIVGDMS
ncbi:MAG: type-F conjugative transfer system secretin TraK [Proteobacteria bacterium]|nr:type-F conjugative transfer system secretin TraK [Pseudomonadota bacterium]